MNKKELMQRLRELMELQRMIEGGLGGQLQPPEFRGGDISPEQEAIMLKDIERRVGKQTRAGLRDVSHDTARRGMFRSGQRLSMKRKVRAGGAEALAGSLAQFYTGKANRMASSNIAGSTFDLNKYRLQLQRRMSQLSGLGSYAGEFSGG